MNADQRERLRIVLQTGILVRRGSVIDEAVAEERARNLTTIVELFFSDVKTETTLPGPPPDPPRSRYGFPDPSPEETESMEAHAERILR